MGRRSRSAARANNKHLPIAAVMYELERRLFLSANTFTADGANAAVINPVVVSFRAQLGGGNVAGPNGSFGGLRREINWDGVPAIDAAPNALPADFFNTSSPRGVVFSTPGTSFQVSGASGDAATAGQPAAANFGNLDATYPIAFSTFSPQRLFTAIGSNVTDVNFFIPGTTTPATTNGFGAVFTDVDSLNTTSLEFFDQNNASLGTFPVAAIPGDGGLSFLGVSFDAGERVSRVRITAGTAALGADDVTQNPLNADVVAMDDFIYGDPSAFIVTNTADSGVGSLRQVILNANTAPATQTISFNIAGVGVQTISPATALPAVSDPAIIDGYTQPGASANTSTGAGNAVLQIELDGTGAPATADGLNITAGGTTVRGLVINRFGRNGIALSTNGGDIIAGNFIGTDSTGTLNRGNSASGVLITTTDNTIGGDTVDARNVISGNSQNGITLDGNSGVTSGNVIQGNIIGLDASGSSALGNLIDGISTDLASDTQIGGTTAWDRNIISGNGNGIGTSRGGARAIQGNYIGTDITGTVALGNANWGITSAQGGSLIGGVVPGAGNLISGNKVAGINLVLASSVVQGNRIGTDVTGTLPIPNLGTGISPGSFSEIGGAVPAAANIIAFNKGPGVAVGESSDGTSIRLNSIFSNDGLGIDLLQFGLQGQTNNDSNDTDTGANHLQNFPVLTSAVSNAGSTTITGVINTNSNVALVIDVYSNGQMDPSGFGEGQTYLGSIPVALDGFTNNGSFSGTFPIALTAGQFITATATNMANAPFGDTSEFSQAIQVTVPPVPPSPPVSPLTIKINDVSHTEGNSGTKDFTFTVSLSAVSASTVTVHYATQNGTASSASDYQFKSGTLTFLPGQTSKTVSVKVNGDTSVEANETFFVKLSSPTNATISDSSGTGTIQNDDPARPKISVSGSSNTEGDSGLKGFTFKVTLDQATSQTVSVHYATINGTAIAGTDYNSASGTVTFAAGETVKTITVFVKGDHTHEADETFFVKLSSAINATIAVGTGKGTIRNDD
jgi:hypothetical protein